jgi:PAS domain-containing protein
MQNMHARKRAVEALWESEERFRRLVENAADAFFGESSRAEGAPCILSSSGDIR